MAVKGCPSALPYARSVGWFLSRRVARVSLPTDGVTDGDFRLGIQLRGSDRSVGRGIYMYIHTRLALWPRRDTLPDRRLNSDTADLRSGTSVAVHPRPCSYLPAYLLRSGPRVGSPPALPRSRPSVCGTGRTRLYGSIYRRMAAVGRLASGIDCLGLGECLESTDFHKEVPCVIPVSILIRAFKFRSLS